MDLPLEDLQVRDDPTYQRDGSIVTLKRATFYLGKHGPFVERVPADANFDAELRTRIDALRRSIENISR